MAKQSWLKKVEEDTEKVNNVLQHNPTFDVGEENKLI